MSSDAIPKIDISTLFRGPSPERDATDQAILTAAGDSGFMTVTGLPAEVPLDPEHRRAVLRIFELTDQRLRPLWRQKFAPEQANLYRGWFPAQSGAVSYKRGMDIGPDLAHGEIAGDPDDPLCEPTPLPSAALLPGWQDAVADYYRGMEATGQALMRALARGLGLAEDWFDDAFRGGISTLRLIQYPPRPDEELQQLPPEQLWVEHNGEQYQVVGKAHVDSGLVTLLAQDGVPGLQARSHDGTWCDVPPTEGTLAVNFGKLLERWSGGRIRATEHRVLGSGRERHSIPFFYEPHVDAEIAPLPGDPPFEAFLYGDHLWAATTQFVEFQGMESLRPPRGGRC